MFALDRDGIRVTWQRKRGSQFQQEYAAALFLVVQGNIEL